MSKWFRPVQMVSYNPKTIFAPRRDRNNAHHWLLEQEKKAVHEGSVLKIDIRSPDALRQLRNRSRGAATLQQSHQVEAGRGELRAIARGLFQVVREIR